MTYLFKVGFDENCNGEGNSKGDVALFGTNVLLALCGDGVEMCLWCDGKLKSTDPNELATGGRTKAGNNGFKSNGCGKMD